MHQPANFLLKKAVKSVLKTLRYRFLKDRLFYYRYICINMDIFNINFIKLLLPEEYLVPQLYSIYTRN